MDRQIVYAGSIPLDTDLLNVQRNVQVALGALARAVLGDSPLIEGMGVVPGSGPYSVVVGAGTLLSLMANDSNPFGALQSDPQPVVRAALLPGSATVQLGAPPDAGHVLCWLIQAAAQETDSEPLALPYWNAANPSIPFAGPGNSGQAQNTQRQLRVMVSAKASAPQSGPFGVAPDPDPGCVGLYAVTTFAGKPQIAAGDIFPYALAPRLQYPLPTMPPGMTRQEVYTSSTSWSVPNSVGWIKVRLCGAGGGGGGGDTNYSGGGGGAGGYAEAILAVQPQQTFVIAIGQGGVGGGPGSTGGTGGTTSFGNGVVAASGGSGGGSNNPDCHGGFPGSGTAGLIWLTGGSGGDGTALALVPGGYGGASAFGGGGRGANEGGTPAQGLALGSGGGGAYGTSATGGTGAGGMIIIEY